MVPGTTTKRLPYWTNGLFYPGIKFIEFKECCKLKKLMFCEELADNNNNRVMLRLHFLATAQPFSLCEAEFEVAGTVAKETKQEAIPIILEAPSFPKSLRQRRPAKTVHNARLLADILLMVGRQSS